MDERYWAKLIQSQRGTELKQLKKLDIDQCCTFMYVCLGLVRDIE